MTGMERLARWAGIVDNRRGNIMRSRRTMQDEMTGREILDPEAVVGPEVEQGRELSVDPGPLPAGLERVKGERDQWLDRLGRLQAEFDNARKGQGKERRASREYAVSNTSEPW